MTSKGKRVYWLLATLLAAAGAAFLIADRLGWLESAEHEKARHATAAAIAVPELPALLGLANPFTSNVTLRAVLAKLPPESPAIVYLAVEDVGEDAEREYSRVRNRPADWLGKFGAVSLSDTGVIKPLLADDWRAVATPAVPVEPYHAIRKSRPDWIALRDRLFPNLALPFATGFEPSADERFVAVLLVDGRMTESSSLPGMGKTQTASGECYVQVHRASDGRSVGPLFHLVGATDAGFYVHGAWILDGKWMLWYETGFRAIWAIRFDWDLEAAKLDQPAQGTKK